MSSNVRMREILEKTISNSLNALELLNRIPSTCGYDGLVDDVSDILCSIRDDAKAATLLPRRNCDVLPRDYLMAKFKEELETELNAPDYEKKIITTTAMAVIDTMYKEYKMEGTENE